MDELKAKHRKELRELQGKITGMKKSVPKGDKKRKKEVMAEIALLEAATEKRHDDEIRALEEELAKQTISEAGDEAKPEEDAKAQEEEQQQQQQPRKTRAQKRREKKAREERERERRIKEAAPAPGTTSKEIEEAALNDALSKLNLSIQRVPADGNCLFKSIEVQLPEAKAKDARALREIAADHMRTHRDDYLPFMTNDKGDMMSPEEFEAYCEKMATTSEWGGQIEIRALAEALNCCIEVFQATAPTQVIGAADAADKVRLSYHRHQFGLGEHYNAVVSSSSSS
ncbi:hypothetical protein PTSG_06825 [Salpingoeca rosetta]|uniref:OTU domain-containing protein n=1 Tax=Salpingoeca rosetta (strain ATCC 50818 / BSB-021) TaxID=946362 RepID=F2UEX2_SALR5|nr:uncharacterized protein PTSG_06825 [Salpingoeca rosetta]EGD75172.1 hypothetical protein PTSG_06825 [Salpingoeca rosetta]|eukprot:XP_004992225.1 hypothetical protein PTSG_06825 [Salpingoeca rosetta]